MYDFAIYQNPKYFSCTLDEDVIGRIKRVTKHTHPSTMSIRTLEHYAVFASQVWIGDLAAQFKKIEERQRLPAFHGETVFEGSRVNWLSF